MPSNVLVGGEYRYGSGHKITAQNVLVRNGPPLLGTENSHNVTSSPHHVKGNAKAEATVKIAKHTLRKIFSKTDYEKNYVWCLAIMEWQKTPNKEIGSSRVQRIMSRRTRSLIPVQKKLLVHEVLQHGQEKLIYKKSKCKQIYDGRARNLPALEIGEGIVVKTRPNHKLEFGTITSRLSSRSCQNTFWKLSKK